MGKRVQTPARRRPGFSPLFPSCCFTRLKCYELSKPLESTPASLKEVLRVLVPNGVAMLGGREEETLREWSPGMGKGSIK